VGEYHFVLVFLQWAGILLTAAAYVAGLWGWIYRGHLMLGLASILITFPILILLTPAYPALLFRCLPLAGVGMFLHRYGSRILMQVKLLWFTTLSVLVVQCYYLFSGSFPGR
jgi:hypothetical protein